MSIHQPRQGLTAGKTWSGAFYHGQFLGIAGGGNGFPGFCALDHSCGGKMVHGKNRNSLWAVYERSKALYLGKGKYRGGRGDFDVNKTGGTVWFC